MNNKQEVLNTIREKGLLPLYYNDSVSVSIDILKALYDAGIRAVEYTNRGAAAVENFREMKKVAAEKMKGLFLGIGTIKTREHAMSFLNAGADFLISPGIPPPVAEFSREHDIFWVPGCNTPTEIILAESYGISFVKIFPGNILGPAYVRSIRDIFPEMQFMPTGGVEPKAENIKSWFDAGVVSVGMGSQLITKAAIQARDYSLIRENTSRALQLIREQRQGNAR